MPINIYKGHKFTLFMLDKQFQCASTNRDMTEPQDCELIFCKYISLTSAPGYLDSAANRPADLGPIGPLEDPGPRVPRLPSSHHYLPVPVHRSQRQSGISMSFLLSVPRQPHIMPTDMLLQLTDKQIVPSITHAYLTFA